MKFLNNLDLQSNELQNAVIHNYAGNPDTALSGSQGQIVYSTTLDKLFVNTDGSTAWDELSTAGGSVTSVSAGNAITVTGTATVPVVNHADTSTQADVNNSGNTFIQDLTFDTYGHVTGVTSTAVSGLDNYSSWTVSDGTNTEAIGSGDSVIFAGGGDVTTSYTAASNTLTVSFTETYTAHENISAASSVDNSGNDFIQDVTLDSNGHVTGLTSATVSGFDNYGSWTIAGDTGSEAIGSGDTMTIAGGGDVSTSYDTGTNTLTVSFTETYTAHENISAATSINGSGNDFIQDVTVDSNGHVTGLVAASVDFTGYLTSESDTLDSVTGRGATTSNAITVGGLTVNGDLTVSGAHTVKLAETVQIEDSIILLNENEAGSPTEDAGFVIERGTSTNVGILWDESADEFVVISSTETGATTGNVVISDYQPLHVGGLTADDASTISGTLTLGSVVNAGVDTDKFLVLDGSGNVDFRTGAEVLSDIGAGAGTMSSWTVAGDTGSEAISDGDTVTIAGGGDVSTAYSTSTNTVTVSFTETYTAHESISAATSVDNSGNTFIQDVTLDGNGHVTGLASATVSGFDNYGSWTISDGTNTEAIGSGDTFVIAGGGDVTTSYSAASNTMTVSFSETYTAHDNISAATSVDNSGFTFIQDVTLDSNGHVTGLASATVTAATTSATGVVELATDAEASTGTDTGRAVTPSGLAQYTADREAVFTISGDATTTAFALTHNFGTRMVMAEVVDFGDAGTGATYETVYPDIERNSDNQVTVTFGAAPSATQDYRVMLRVIA